MSKVSANISIDSEVKAQAQILFADLGMDLSTAVNVFLRQAIRENGMPFEITRAQPNTVTMAAIRDTAEGCDLHGPFDSVSALMEALNASD